MSDTISAVAKNAAWEEVAASNGASSMQTGHFVQQLINAIEQRHKEEVEKFAPVCEHCKSRPATCYGAYEDNNAPEQYACDECCGHGNEDGHCQPLPPYDSLRSQLRERDAEIARLKEMEETWHRGAMEHARIRGALDTLKADNERLTRELLTITTARDAYARCAEDQSRLHAEAARTADSLQRRVELLETALRELLCSGLRGADDYRLCLIACKQDALDTEELASAERFGKAADIAREVLNTKALNPTTP